MSAATCRKVSHHAKVAWCKRNTARKECTRANVVQEIQRGQTFGRRHQQELECSNGIRSRGVEEQEHLRKGRKSAKSIGGWRRQQPQLESMGNSNKVFRKIMGIEFVKRANWMSSRLKRIIDWTLCSGQPPPKRKKKLKVQRQPVM
jgi:hypothetical protein